MLALEEARARILGALAATQPSAASASSCSRMPSAPSGTKAPVKMRTAWPGPTDPSKGCPAGAAPMTASRAPSAASAARTA